MEFVTTINRSSKTLFGTWDGKQTRFKPNDKLSLPRLAAEAAQRQNPVMGSEDPSIVGADGLPQMQYLIGIEENGDDCSPIEQTNEIERWDRSKLIGALPTEVRPAPGGLYSMGAVKSTLPFDSNFVKP